ncbi:MAG: metallophosphoesterase [Clostridia bacterium]|nr:metallophosphoesterase [Clostridia bacterium]
MRILFATDIHLCHMDYEELPTSERMDLFVGNVINEYRSEPFEALILLGDYSLDHWSWQIQGCYINEGISNAEAFAKNYLAKIKAALPNVKIIMLAGNHEQYGDVLWNKFTGGYSRQDYAYISNWLFIGLDTYGADLDPTEHSDGTYTGIDEEYVTALMNSYPEANVVLCAHYFDYNNTDDKLYDLLGDPRVKCAICGHNHKWDYVISDKTNGKPLFFAGEYSYKSVGTNPGNPMWGYRDFIIDDNSLTSRYITPELTIHNKYFPREYYSELKIDI